MPDPTHDAQLYVVGELSGEEGPCLDDGEYICAYLLLCVYCFELCTYIRKLCFELLRLFLKGDASGSKGLGFGVKKMLPPRRLPRLRRRARMIRFNLKVSHFSISCQESEPDYASGG